MSRTQSKLLRWSLLAVALVAVRGHADPVADLYVAQVSATGLSGTALDDAFALALGQVLVKVTGQRDFAADPGRRNAVGPAGPLVSQYQPVAGGALRVSFDPGALRRRLDAANLPVWPADRPRTLVILPAELFGDPLVAPGQLLNATAASRGVPVVVTPGAASPAADPLADPDATMRAAGANALLVGRSSPASGQASLRWTLVQGGERAEWQGDVAAGAHGLADRLALRYATLAASSQLLRLRIEGVDSFDAYGRLQSYLRSVGLIQRSELQRVTSGALIYELDVRGDVAQLNDALALQRVLVPAPAAGPGELVYRLATSP